MKKMFLTLTAVIGLLLSLDATSQTKYKDMVWLTPTNDVNAFCFSPDSKYIASAGGYYIDILEVATGSIVKKLWLENDHTKQKDITDVKWSKDGRYIVCAANNKVTIFDAATYDTLNILEDNNEGAFFIGIPDDCTFLVAAIRQSSLKIWDLKTGKVLAKKNVWPPTGYTAPEMKEMKISSTGNMIVVNGWFVRNDLKETIKYDSVYNAKSLETLPLLFHGRNYVFSNSGKYLALLSYDLNAPTSKATGFIINDIGTGQMVKNISFQNNANFAPLDFSIDEKYLITLKNNRNNLVIYKIQSWDSVYSYSWEFLKSIVSPNGNFILADGGDTTGHYLALFKANWDNTPVNENPDNYKTEILNYYPNPVNSNIQIEYSLESNSNLKISISNLNGEMVETLFTGYETQGKHIIEWNTSLVSAGAYFINLTAAGKTISKNIIVTK
ncbi:MAG: apaf1 [Ignavibacteria bacterium]|nr:apaf1 [Ignavibacteria bacterium]